MTVKPPSERTVLLDYHIFRVERWYIPVDARAESIIRMALVWDMDDEDKEQVVLLSPLHALRVATALTTGEPIPLEAS